MNRPEGPRFQRVLLKLSGEALAGAKGHGVDPEILSGMATEIASVVASGVQVAIVIGGGNLVRGATASKGGVNRAQGDAMGMLATVMNCLAMQDALDKVHCPSVIMSGVRMEPICPYFDRREAISLLQKGTVVLFAAGTGNPFFTTDTASALRAIESECQVILKATKVDGVYTADPAKHPDATRYERLPMLEAIQKNLGVMDLAAFALCQEHKMPILVFRMDQGNLSKALHDPSVGTLVEP